ncbi:MAG: phosphoenolpyruvate carboxylase, partial [Flavobacteriales bacterium]
KAMEENDLVSIRKLLHQLGLTPFFQTKKPTPYEEAVRQSWYLEHVFFEALPKLALRVAASTGVSLDTAAGLFSVGFWPGGDRDGNPYVDAGTTLRVARRLRLTLLRCYRRSFRQLRRRITFKGLDIELDALQSRVEEAILDIDSQVFDDEGVLEGLEAIEERVRQDFGGLHAEDIARLRVAILMFGRHFAAIDIRQDSRVLRRSADALGLPEGIPALLASDTASVMPEDTDEVVRDAWEVMGSIREIQQLNGSRGCHRFIISNCRGAEDVIRLYTMARHAHAGDAMALDFVPLFETVDDLAGAPDQMRLLFDTAEYREHVAQRQNVQHVMLGFSDGTKDGGYLRANWSIHQAKERLSAVCRESGVEVVFFDGRGGPPARGGGNTHRF